MVRENRAIHQGKKKGSPKMGRTIKFPVKNARLIWERVWRKNAREKMKMDSFLFEIRKNIKLTP